MKHAHNINSDEEGKPIKHFFYIPWWWIGVIGIVSGEVGNLIAYGYAPATVVTPMGAIGVVTNVFITTVFLKEKVNKINILGVLFVIGGIITVVYFSPATTIIITSATFFEDVVNTTQGITYLCLVAVATCIMVPTSYKFGHKHVVIYVLTCASIASLTIVSAKAFSSLLTSAFAFGFEKDWLNPWPYVLLVILVVTAVSSMSYINKAMMIFGNSQVVPTYYSLFTTVSVASTAFVYREFSCMVDGVYTALFVLGIAMAMTGVFLVQWGQKDDIIEAQFSRQNSASNKVCDDVEQGMIVPKPPEEDKEAAAPMPPKQAGYVTPGKESNGYQKFQNDNAPTSAFVDYPVKQEPAPTSYIASNYPPNPRAAASPPPPESQVHNNIQNTSLPGSVLPDHWSRSPASHMPEGVGAPSPNRKRLGTLRPLPVKKGSKNAIKSPEKPPGGAKGEGE